jgi:hypothetical protein
MGIRSRISRSTLADANEVRDWRIYAAFAQRLITMARKLYVDEPFGVDLNETVYALDATTIDLCLSVFPWAPFRTTKAAVKLHTLLDLRGNIPAFIHISDGKMHDVNVLDRLLPEAGAFYVMDRGYLDFERLFPLHTAGSFFVTRGKSNLKAQRRYSRPVDRSHRPHLRSDGRPDGLLLQPELRHAAATHPIQRPQERQAAGVPDQQLPFAGTDDHRTVSLPMAGRTVLQVDQAASSDQAVLWHDRERREDADLDRRLDLRTRRDRQKAIEDPSQPLRNATDPEPDHVRANPFGYAAFSNPSPAK